MINSNVNIDTTKVKKEDNITDYNLIDEIKIR